MFYGRENSLLATLLTHRSSRFSVDSVVSSGPETLHLVPTDTQGTISVGMPPGVAKEATGLASLEMNQASLPGDRGVEAVFALPAKDPGRASESENQNHTGTGGYASRNVLQLWSRFKIPYESIAVGRLLGKGSFGDVYACELNQYPGCAVALKQLKEHLKNDEAAR